MNTFAGNLGLEQSERKQPLQAPWFDLYNDGLSTPPPENAPPIGKQGAVVGRP